jgi:hypothetical protein
MWIPLRLLRIGGEARDSAGRFMEVEERAENTGGEVYQWRAAMGQATEPAAVFRPAIEQIQHKTRIAILLPSKLPSPIHERDIKLASATVSEEGYSIALYFSEIGRSATFAAGFGGSSRVVRDLPNTRPVALAGGLMGMFRPVSCGGSCAPANLWWEQSGVMYQIQIRLGSETSDKDQERILVETANSSVVVRRE